MVDKVEMKKEDTTEKLVKVKALRPFFKKDGTVAQPGAVVEVTESMAQDLCKPIQGAHSYVGERFGADIARHNLTRAQLVA